MEAAAETVSRSNVSRMERIKSCASSECVTGCNGTWVTMAKQVLRNTHIHEIVFAAALQELLEKGRGKNLQALQTLQMTSKLESKPYRMK